ncbi:hypothetical protein [uncultured Nostoc sp.]|uniref:hypothetical protein n=1 Tax=uncultured Nostoc sp. TaxID=340711 RepID=UPI002604046F|nr:hypothetical protein [uncultured Nostoc sp.]
MSRWAPTEAIEESPTNRAHAAAIEMMNLHESSVTTLIPQNQPKCVRLPTARLTSLMLLAQAMPTTGCANALYFKTVPTEHIRLITCKLLVA